VTGLVGIGLNLGCLEFIASPTRSPTQMVSRRVGLVAIREFLAGR
jgi:hypothetical protein